MAPLRRSLRRQGEDIASKGSAENMNDETAEMNNEEDADREEGEAKLPSPRTNSKPPNGAKKSSKRSFVKKAKDTNVSVTSEETPHTKSASESLPPTETSTKATAKKRKSPPSSLNSSSIKKIAKSKKEKVPVQAFTERDPLPKLWTPSDKNKSKCFKIVSWNVAGLRAVCKKIPSAMSDLVKKYDYPDLICVQETKLQDFHVEDPKLMLKGYLLEPEGYDSYWSCSTAKKGYSGTAVFIKRQGGKSLSSNEREASEVKEQKAKTGKQASLTSFFTIKKKETTTNGAELASNMKNGSSPKLELKESESDYDTNFLPESITNGLNNALHDDEGRSIIIDYPLFSVLNLYVPNSGQKLERLGHRTDKWDKHLVKFVKAKEKERGVPVIWVGDLNVAHKSLDVWNEGAKHLPKCAGTTAEERESFSLQLQEGFIDLFRHLHPEAKGQYTFWSTRAGNRPFNKGLRLDYFVGSKCLVVEDKKGCCEAMVRARDSYIDPDQLGSDHCPVILELEIKR